MPKTIIVEIDKKGELTLETKGFKGGECLKETESLKEVLGKVDREEKTQEYYEKPEQAKLYTGGK